MKRVIFIGALQNVDVFKLYRPLFSKHCKSSINELKQSIFGAVYIRCFKYFQSITFLEAFMEMFGWLSFVSNQMCDKYRLSK